MIIENEQLICLGTSYAYFIKENHLCRARFSSGTGMRIIKDKSRSGIISVRDSTIAKIGYINEKWLKKQEEKQ